MAVSVAGARQGVAPISITCPLATEQGFDGRNGGGSNDDIVFDSEPNDEGDEVVGDVSSCTDRFKFNRLHNGCHCGKE